MRIQSLTLDYPPRRNIGSEMYTHRLNVALAAQHDVKATTVSLKANPGVDRIPVEPFGWGDMNWADLFVCHADYAGPVMGRGRPVVGICHNTQEGVLLSVHTNHFELVICNSQTMRDELEARDMQPYLVVRPPAPAPQYRSKGDLVTIVNLNENKVGRFWAIAASMPEQRFLAVLGGYGDQIVPDIIPANVEVLDHVPAGRMSELVWARTRLLLAPSERESWNMTAGEALAHGITTISTDLPGVRENLGDTATYLDRMNVSAWVNAIRQEHPAPAAALEMARHNFDRHRADLDRYVKAVTALGDHHREAA